MKRLMRAGVLRAAILRAGWGCSNCGQTDSNATHCGACGAPKG